MFEKRLSSELYALVGALTFRHVLDNAVDRVVGVKGADVVDEVVHFRQMNRAPTPKRCSWRSAERELVEAPRLHVEVRLERVQACCS